MKWLNFHHLMYFREIAIEKSVSKAAAKLHLGQPALSGQLKKLEENFGRQLFDRKNRKLILTEAGKFVLQCANDIHRTGTMLVDVMEKGTLSSRIHLNIGALDSVPKHLILKLIADAREAGEFKVRIIEGRAEELLRELQAHSLDILISNYHAPISDRGGLYSKPLTKNAIAVYGTEKYKRLRLDFPKSINNEALILPTLDSKLRHDIEHFFRINDLKLNVFAETQDTSIQKLLGSEGFGLIALPEFSAKELVDEKKMFKLGIMTGVFEEFWLITAKRSIDNPIASWLAREFKFSPSFRKS